MEESLDSISSKLVELRSWKPSRASPQNMERARLTIEWIDLVQDTPV